VLNFLNEKNMKKIIVQISLWTMLAAVAGMFTACSLDNYDEPDAQITGRVIDRNGNPVGVMGSREQVTLQLWQPSYPLHADAINVNVAQDGSFTARVFDGTYVLKMRNNTGPWVYNAEDSVVINLSGSANVDFPVTPYYTLGNITYSLNGTTLSATFNVTEVTPGRSIEEVALMVNKTQFVGFDSEVRVKMEQGNTTTGSQTITVDISDLTAHNKLYARVGLRISGIGQGLYDTKTFEVR
jgi:hypothetical protein